MNEVIRTPLRLAPDHSEVVLMHWPNSAWEYSVGQPPVGGYVDDHRWFGSKETALRYLSLAILTGELQP